jgi:hypothetical protein
VLTRRPFFVEKQSANPPLIDVRFGQDHAVSANKPLLATFAPARRPTLMKTLKVVGSVFLLGTLGCAGHNLGSSISDHARTTTAKAEAPIQVEVTTDLSAMTYTIVISNSSGHPVLFWDTLSADSRYTRYTTGPAWIRIWDATGKLLTGNVYHSDGWWDPSVYSNTIWPLPVSMSTLPTDARQVFTYSLKNLCFGFTNSSAAIGDASRWMDGKQMQLRATLYYEDPSLRICETVETAKITVPSETR